MAQPKKFRPEYPSGPQPEFQPAQSISARHMMKAAGVFPCSEGAARYHRRRIAEWGRLNREVLRSLGARFVKRAA